MTQETLSVKNEFYIGGTFMKKFLSIILCVSLFFSILSCSVSAETIAYQSNETVWSVTKDGYVNGYYGTDPIITVPDKISEITVIGIADNTFEDMSFIEEITLPETVTYIGSYAFKNCSGLQKIVAPGVTTVRIQSFYKCSNLDNIYMPSLTTLSKECFRWCGALNGLTTEKITLIPQYAFSGSKITDATFPNVTTIYNNAFSFCKNLIEASFPSLIDGNLYENVFSSCIKLKKVTFPENFVSLGGSTFAGTTISDFSFLENIQYVYTHDFNYCQNVEKLYLPNVTLIDVMAFDYMSSVKEIILPSCTTVLEQAFSNNRYLEKVVFSNDLESVGPRIFVDCPALTYIVLNGLTESTENIFLESAINRVEFNKIKNIAYLPETENSIIALPSTFEACSEDTNGRNYRIYGTKGSTAQIWAETNGHTFYEISQENSIVTDVPEVYSNSTGSLFFDAIGINSKYQWYGSFDAIVSEDDKAIENAVTNSLTLQEGDKYPYYYCKMTSTDIDENGNITTVEIQSSVCKNELCYIYAKNETVIDYGNKIIYTSQNQTDIADILNIQNTTVYDDVPSYAYNDTKSYGTGSLFVVYENNLISEVYTVVIQGDINGDGVINVIDITELEKTVNGNKELTDIYLVAGDINNDSQITASDLQQVLNLFLKS